MSKKFNKRLATLDDGCNPFLVEGANFEGALEIPVIQPLAQKLTLSGITPFSQRDIAVGTHNAIGFFEKDPKFAQVLITPESFVEDFQRFDCIISVDCSLYRDAPLAVQITNLYRNRALGSYYQRHGVEVIPLIRWGNEFTYTTKYFPEKIAFLGAPHHSTLCIGTYGCIKTAEDKYHFKAGLKAMLETLEPMTVIVYGSMPNNIFEEFLESTQFICFPDWITLKHGGGLHG